MINSLAVNLICYNPDEIRSLRVAATTGGVTPKELAMVRVNSTPLERFWAKVELQGDCLVWTGYRNAGGYGVFGVDGRAQLAHRWIYIQTKGEIPGDFPLDHLCRNRACVKVEHLEPVPIQVNIRRGIAPAAQNARATHCKYGHPFDEANTKVRPNGKRDCLTCITIANRTRIRTERDNERARNWYHKNAERVIAQRRAKRAQERENRPPKELAAFCRKGHSFAETAITDRNGVRRCAICRVKSNQAYQQRRGAKQ